MDIYLDLSFFSSIIIHLLCLVYLKLMYEYKNNIYKDILLVFLLSIIVFSLPFFVIDNVVIYIVYDLLILYALLPKKNKLYMMGTYLVIYYILLGLAQLLNKGIIVKAQMIVINKPLSTVSILILFIPIILIYLISFILKNQIILLHYKYNVYLKVNDNIYHLKGYLDSGNTLLIDGKPVIFIKEKILLNENLIDGKKIKYQTLNNTLREDIAYPGELIITINYRKIYKKIIFSVVSDEYYFNNCDCLLSAYCK